jgi:hypothetical protein
MAFSNYLPESRVNLCAFPGLVQVWHPSQSWVRYYSTHLLFIATQSIPHCSQFLGLTDDIDPSSHSLFAAHQAGLIEFKPVQHRLNLVLIKLITAARFNGNCWTQTNRNGCSFSSNPLIQVFTSTMCLDQLKRCFQTNPVCSLCSTFEMCGCCRLIRGLFRSV